MTVGSSLHETVSAVRCLGIAHSETHCFNPTRLSLAALPLNVESSYFRADASLLESYSDVHARLLPGRREGGGPDPRAGRQRVRNRTGRRVPGESIRYAPTVAHPRPHQRKVGVFLKVEAAEPGHSI